MSSDVSGQAFALTHTYVTAGTFTVTVQLSDGVASSVATATVTVVAPPPPPPPVETPAQLLTDAIALVDGLVANHKLGRALGTTMDAELTLARGSLARGRPTVALAAVRTVAAELDLLLRLRVLSAADARPLRTLIDEIILAIAAG